ncbi:Mov34/MPN/PAD-1 family protein [Corallococcus exercitus]|uniref:Mov34/MPN/PAD-1 family protein n=1 Tax=Corallococcus exercitus TaxID=2316736 RepID=UPI0013153A19|nr:Mov34/MPN/PAD-1 family protein [Corallococcus exercitus]
MPDLEFRSEDACFQMHLPQGLMRKLLKLCRSSTRHETGGILVGHYSQALDCARVRNVSAPPPDSARGPTWFERGTNGLQALLDRSWNSRRDHYLGEWHFHPFAAPIPSATDVRQLMAIARDPRYRCPEPLLLIVGGDPAGEWSISIHVVPRDAEVVPLLRV